MNEQLDQNPILNTQAIPSIEATEEHPADLEEFDESAIAEGDENWVEVDEGDGVINRYLIDNILECDFEGTKRDYAIMIAETDMKDDGTVEKLTIARWENNGEDVFITPVESEAEAQEVLEQIQAFYDLSEEEKEANTIDNIPT